MKDARLVGAIQTTSDFSYHNRRLAGPRLLRVGDAAGFMDPIFSAGVFLAMWSGKLAAEVVGKCLQRGRHPTRACLRPTKSASAADSGFTGGWWRTITPRRSWRLFLCPSNHYDLPSAVIAVLAGELEGGWSLRWRLEYFFLLVKIQRFFPLVPRIFFGPGSPRTLNPSRSEEKT